MSMRYLVILDLTACLLLLFAVQLFRCRLQLGIQPTLPCATGMASSGNMFLSLWVWALLCALHLLFHLRVGALVVKR